MKYSLVFFISVLYYVNIWAFIPQQRSQNTHHHTRINISEEESQAGRYFFNVIWDIIFIIIIILNLKFHILNNSCKEISKFRREVLGQRVTTNSLPKSPRLNIGNFKNTLNEYHICFTFFYFYLYFYLYVLHLYVCFLFIFVYYRERSATRRPSIYRTWHTSKRRSTPALLICLE